MGFLWQECWERTGFHSLLQWTTFCQNSPLLPMLVVPNMAHSFTELQKPLYHEATVRRLQQYVNHELPDVQAGFRKGRGTRDQIANIRGSSEKQESSRKNIYFCFIDYANTFDCVDHNKLWKSERDGNARPSDLRLEKSVCKSGSNS